MWDKLWDFFADTNPLNLPYLVQGVTGDSPSINLSWSPGLEGRVKAAMQGIPHTRRCDSDGVAVGVARHDLERAGQALRKAGLL